MQQSKQCKTAVVKRKGLEEVTVHQFVITKTEKQKLPDITYKELYKIMKVWKEYLIHKYKIYNDVLHWPRVLSTVEELGTIFHMDYSENVTSQVKSEPQSGHFNKKQYSLHCTVQHDVDNYFYHFSNVKTHGFAYTFSVIKHLNTEITPGKLMRFKSDNCNMQYKCKWVFRQYQLLANEKHKKLLCIMV